MDTVWGRGLGRGRGSRGAPAPRGALCTALTAPLTAPLHPFCARVAQTGPPRLPRSAVPRGEPRTGTAGIRGDEGQQSCPEWSRSRGGRRQDRAPLSSRCPGAANGATHGCASPGRRGQRGSGTRGGLCLSCICGHRGHRTSNAPVQGLPAPRSPQGRALDSAYPQPRGMVADPFWPICANFLARP